jgi:hypothetical protein
MNEFVANPDLHIGFFRTFRRGYYRFKTATESPKKCNMYNLRNCFATNGLTADALEEKNLSVTLRG